MNDRASKERRQPRREKPDSPADGTIEGRNAVIEALRVGTAIDKILIAKGETDATLGHIASKAREQGIVVVEADRRKLDAMSQTHSHQGVIAIAAVREYASVEDILNRAREAGEPPLVVICDEISDPHNLGAVIRTAECAGAHGVISQAPQRRTDGNRGKDLCRGGVPSACGESAQPDRLHRGAEGAGALGVRFRRRGQRGAVPDRPEGACRHCHRFRGQRHEPPCGTAL